MDNEFMSNLQTEESNPFEGLGSSESETPETETPAESAPETKPAEEPESSPEPKVEEPAEAEPEAESDAKAFHAFHEHPRWIAREKELQELREKNEELMSFKERVNPFIEKLEKPSQTAPTWFTNLYGDNPEIWGQYQEANRAERKQIREEILNELKPDLEEIRSVKEQKKLQDWANEQWNLLGSNEQVQKELKNMGLTLDKVQGEISEVMSKYKPSDDEGNISLKNSYELWKATRKAEIKPSPVVAEKKKVAAITRSSEPEPTKKVWTSDDFRGKSIHDLTD